MATYNKFQAWAETSEEGADIGADTFKVMLVNSPAPVATNSVKADLTEISAGSGYSAGGTALSGRTSAQSGGTLTLAANQVVFTASGGTIGPFRYAVLYDDTLAGDPLVSWWDYGSSITLQDGETFTVKFNNADPGTIYTKV